MARLLIVSNRLPISVQRTDGHVQVNPSTGGLATGLKGPHERLNGLWIGWPGDTENLSAEEMASLEAQLRDLRTVPVHLTSAEVNGFYVGLSNGVLWPLFHYLIDRIPYEQHDWEMYREVNERFAEAVIKVYRPGDIIWVHDYQLMLVPSLLRTRLPDARIGFFLHIPFPAAEVFRLLPWREEILRGLLGADVIGFHTFSYVRQFLNTLTLVLGLIPGADRVHFDGRDVKVSVYPMGIDASEFDRMAREPEIKERVEKLRADLGDAKLLLGVDRLDYTKGIPRRLLAIERMFEKDPSLHQKIRFVQIAVPSRTDVPQYETFTNEVQQLVGRINGRFSTPSFVPIHFIHQGFAQRDLVASYLCADAMLVTPLRDGMNLVAKEFVATRFDEGGILLLSEFAGAASEMGEAILVNPYDIDGTADAIVRALRLSGNARQIRMKALRERVFRYDVHRWASDFIHDLEGDETYDRTRDSEVPPTSQLKSRIDQAPSVLLFLDYDGTLVPFARRPEFAEPDVELIEILSALAKKEKVHVHVVSGRRRQLLEDWLGALPIGLHAEHGAWSREPGQTWQLNLEPQDEWRETVAPILREFALRTPGSLVEEKTASLAFHYRMADVEYGEWQARELKIHLAHALSNLAVEVLSGNKVIEVRPHGVNKAIIVPRLLEVYPGAFVIAAGDDATDEQLFRSVPENGLSICIGSKSPQASLSLPSVRSLRELLRNLFTI